MPGQTFFDPCTGTFEIVTACMLLPRHHCFVASKIDTVCFKESLLVVVNVFARHVLIEESNIVSEAYVQDAAKFFVSSTDSISAKRKKLLWMPCVGFVPHSRFLAILCTSYPIFLENPRCIRCKRHFCYHNGRKDGEGGCTK